MAGVINEDGHELIWIAKYWRYHVLCEVECESLEEAVEFLESGEDAGELSSDSIVGPDGKVVHNFQTGDMGDRVWTYRADRT